MDTGRLLKNDPEQQGRTDIEMAHILLPESRNAIGPALDPYLDKINDAVYFLRNQMTKKR
jgi:hypothetical protein